MNLNRKISGFVSHLLLVFALYVIPSSVSADEFERSKNSADSLNSVYQLSSDLIYKNGTGNNLPDLLKLGLRINPSIKESFYNWRAAIDRASFAGTLPDPVLSFGYFMERVETRVGPQRYKIGLRQSLPWFGTLGTKSDVARSEALASEMNYESRKQSVTHDIKTVYYELYYLGKLKSLTLANFEILKFWESVTQTKYKTAQVSHHDLIKVQIELGILEDRLIGIDKMIPPVKSNLAALLNSSDISEISIPDTIYIEDISTEIQFILDRIIDGNPALKSIAYGVQKGKAAVRLSGKISMPAFTIGVDYIETGPALIPSMPESGKDPLMLNVGMTLPIWFGKNKAVKNQSRARLMAEENKLANARNTLIARVEKILFEYDEAKRKLVLYRDGLIPRAEEALNVGYAAFQAGQIDIVSLLDSQRQLLHFQEVYERARTDLAIKISKIEMLMGKPLTFEEHN
ncbi:MAG: TolC family protein [candidate division Zixibacteria bacterium]